MLRNFYMDNHYRKQWDNTVVEHNQLQLDESDGSEVGRTVKKIVCFVSLDFQLPDRFKLEFSAEDEAKIERPVMIHSHSRIS
ncbi:hypothetical protein RYX36_026140 [Vicia faba]